MAKGRGYLRKVQKALAKKNKKSLEQTLLAIRSQCKTGSNEWIEKTVMLALHYCSRRRFKQAKELASNLDLHHLSNLNNLQRGTVHSLLGNIAFQENELEKAIPFLESAKENLPITETDLLKTTTFNLVEAYKRIGKLDQAITHLTASIEIIRVNDLLNLSTAIMMLSDLYKDNNEPEKAKQIKTAYYDDQVNSLLAKPYATDLPAGFPPKWGKDAITHLSTGGLLNEFHAIDRFKSEVEKANLAHAKFTTAMNSAQYFLIGLLRKQVESQKQKPTKIVASNIQFSDEELLELFFLLRCHASFLSATQVAMRGEITETYPILRSCLENALYAYHVNLNPDLKQVWLGRNSTNRKEVGWKFSVNKKILPALASSNPNLGKLYDELYELTIDKGAHPNVETLRHSLQVTEGKAFKFVMDYLNPQETGTTLADCVKVADAVIELYRYTYPDWCW